MFCPNKVENRTHSKGYVEDFPPKCGQKRCVKMVVPNLSVLPKMENLKWNDENVENSSLTEILSLVRIVSVD